MAACVVGLGLLAAGCGSAELPGEDRTGKPVKLFFTGGEQFRPVKRELPVSRSTLPAAAAKLVEGPTASELAGGDPAQTQIPAATELEGLRVADGEAVVELSEEFLAEVPYFNLGIAFHEYPEVPHFPASHGCVRVPVPEAEFVYSFAAIGTSVRVF